ncbi:zinc-binding dehydrogenase [Acinetobacter nosocomialis]|uniref:zinc-binding dehydrogenase n=1 Tax=Acinetobacter nosocomialis TaxID=106654 RepID=UPI001B8428CB|nr:zinc-binding dehydrogenase [Acinetobacter nosocomialis]MBR7713520.1 zinc-binding dehydrogenase [Acinetobacter nosocomialis]
MKSVLCHQATLQVVDQPNLTPAKGQVLLEVVRCGICGSDLHMQHHCDHMHDLAARVGFNGLAKSTDPFVLGHEFCGKVLDYGPKTRHKFKADTLVCAMPLLNVDQHGYLSTGLSPNASGGYAEQVLAQSSLMFEVPNGLDADSAAMTEPMAVALHAVRRSRVKTSEPAIVVGCGPVGLGVILMLKAAGVKTVVASDFSPNRRKLAEQCGADIVVDPKETSPFANWKEFGLLGNVSDAINMGMGLFDKLQATRLPWWHGWRMIDKLGALPKRPVIFECVGVPGVLQQIIEGAPLFSRIVGVGVCMQSDKIEPALAINKELEIQFVLGYTPLEFRDALHMIAEGKVNCSPLITGVIGLEGVTSAFEALRDPEQHAKILIDPKRSGSDIQLMKH